jgi:co-chaperonin GroES (HSP10)
MKKEQSLTLVPPIQGNLKAEVPKHNHALEEKYKSEKPAKPKETKRLDPESIKGVIDELPNPSGYRLLVLPFTPKEKTKGGIIYAQESLDKARIATNCGYVLKMGPLAYFDREKFSTGPWCKKGDWVIFARYAGSRLPIEGGEIRILNDDEVLGTIKDPESVLHYV